MIGRIVRSWWGDFSKEELEKFALLATIFGLIIGVYWYLRPLKDAIFMSVVGKDYIPYAKYLSLIVVFPLVIIYSKLVDMFPRHRLFYAICTIYSIIGLGFALIMSHPTWGLADTVASTSRWWGWAWYVYVESFGSLVAALFWAFAADTTTPESAQRGYPLVIFGAQMGNIFGPAFAEWFLEYFTNSTMGPEGEISVEAARQNSLIMAGSVALAAVIIASIMLLVKYFMAVIPKEQLVGYHGSDEKESEPGFFEGLKILVTSPYLLGIFAIITFYEVIVTVLDFNFKTFVGTAYPDAHASAIYLASYGKWVGIVSLLSVVLGINKIQKLLGLDVSLALLPLIIAAAVMTFKGFPVLSMLFWIMVVSKAINYALNQPSMKQLYIPTSKDAKYKSQAFIEMYGSRGSKALGSYVNTWRKPLIDKLGPIVGLNTFVAYCTYVSLGIVGVWFFVALYLGRTFNKAVKERRTIC